MKKIRIILSIGLGLFFIYKGTGKLSSDKLKTLDKQLVEEYIIENLSNQDSTGIATFVYFPNKLGDYIRKINCFCYDAQTLKPKEKNKFTLVLLIDPEVTKDSKTKNIKEATIQFTFFDYKEYKKKKS